MVKRSAIGAAAFGAAARALAVLSSNGLSALPGESIARFVLGVNKHRTEIIAPWVVGVGFNWNITPWLELGAEFRYYFNSQVDVELHRRLRRWSAIR